MPLYQITEPTFHDGVYTSATPYKPGFVTGDEAPAGGVLMAVKPAITDVVVVATETGATITWTTDAASDSIVRYRVALGSWNRFDAEEIEETSHEAVLADLTGQTPYEFQVQSTGADGGMGSSDPAFFATASAA